MHDHPALALITPDDQVHQIIPNHPFTVLGLDFGLAYIGLAIGSSITQISTPLVSLRAHQGQPNWSELDRWIHDYHPALIIVGLPTMMDGTPQAITFRTLDFITELKPRYALPICTTDERLTTVAAREQLFDQYGQKGLTRDQVNAFSAKIIVEQWLAHHLP